MKVRVPDYYKDFKCIAGECTDTCCAGWQVDVDDDTYEYYRNVSGDFGKRLHEVMIDGKKGEEGRLRIRQDGRCPFLNDNNLCDIYSNLGEDALCVTCSQYPRFTTEYGSLRETGIALSCKTAAGLILSHNTTPGFTETEDDGTYPSLNNIDAELFYALSYARNKAYEIVWNRKYGIWDRLSVLVYYATDLQKNIRSTAGLRRVVQLYDDKYIEQALECIKKEQFSEYDIYDSYKGYFYNFLKQSIIKKEWVELIYSVYDNVLKDGHSRLLSGFYNYYRDKEYEFENIITYFLSRYFLKAVFDRDVLTKVKIGIISVLTIYQCDIAYWVSHNGELNNTGQIEIVHIYSREVEHSEENFARLCRLFSHKRMYAPKKLVLLLQANSERQQVEI